MKKTFLLLFGLIANLFSTQAQENSLLWKVSGKNLTKPSYLFGTIHAICDDDFLFNETMQKAFASTNQLVMEINLTDPKMMQQYQQAIMGDEKNTLKSVYTNEEDLKKLQEELKGTDISVVEYLELNPIALISILSMKAFNCKTTASYEAKLIEMTYKNKTPIQGLETADYQLSIFSNMSHSDIQSMLLASAQDLKDPESINKLTKLYLNQNISGLYDYILKTPEMAQHADELLYKRNKNWASKLVDMMQENSSFVAVGAGHLAGEKGLINLLKKAGYTVEAVK